jgi:uncharacterized membrane protein YccC
MRRGGQVDANTPDMGRIGRLQARVDALRRRLPTRHSLVAGLQHGVIAATAALVAYLPTQALGLREGFWAAITAIAVVQTEFVKTRSMARDQFAGAAIGGMIGVAVVSTAGQHLLSYALAVILSVVACWVLNVASAARLGGITATIILLVPHQGTAEAMLVSRVMEVGWGVTVAIAGVWTVEWIRLRGKSHGAD